MFVTCNLDSRIAERIAKEAGFLTMREITSCGTEISERKIDENSPVVITSHYYKLPLRFVDTRPNTILIGKDIN